MLLRWPQTIALPADPQKVAILERQLRMYQWRLQASERLILVLPGMVAVTRYKAAIAERLLKRGCVEPEKLAVALLEREGDAFDAMIFENACRVIRSYCA